MQTAQSLARTVVLPPCVQMSPNPKPERLPVLRPHGGLAYLAGVDTVHDLIRTGLAKPFGPRRRLDGCILLAPARHLTSGTKYTYSAETENNTRGVYTLVPITHLDRELFMRVQTDCLA